MGRWSAVAPLLAGMAPAMLSAQTLPAASPLELIRQAEAAIGSADKWRRVHIVRLKALSRRNAVEQSVRPEGPWAETIADIVETRDLDQGALAREARTRGYDGPWWSTAAWQSSGLIVRPDAVASRGPTGDVRPGSAAAAADARELLALGPERVLFTAAAAHDLRLIEPAELHGYRHDVLAFTWRQASVRLYLEPVSHMPAMVELTRTRPADIFWSPWGDVTTRVTYDQWTLEANGLHYPRRWEIESNGMEERAISIDEVAFDPPTPDDSLAIPAVIAAAARIADGRRIDDVPFPADAAVTAVSDGIAQIAAAWNVGEIAADGGVYILEAPIGNRWSQQVLDREARLGRRVLGVVTTLDSWPHIGGLREYVARGVPVYHLDLNGPIARAS